MPVEQSVNVAYIRSGDIIRLQRGGNRFRVVTAYRDGDGFTLVYTLPGGSMAQKATLHESRQVYYLGCGEGS